MYAAAIPLNLKGWVNINGMLGQHQRNSHTNVRTVVSGLATLHTVSFTPILQATASIETKNDEIAIKGQIIYVNKEKFIIKGIEYSPWRSGTGPNKNYPYPSESNIEEDLKLIKSTNANTIFVYDPPEYLFDIGEKYNLKVMYIFTINWYSIDSLKDVSEKNKILATVQKLKQKKSLLGWALGNEIPENLIAQNGKEVYEESLHRLYNSIKAIDDSHPITFCNWPPTKGLNLNFLDIIGFNVYPAWPPEVALKGYKNYILEDLKLIAGNKPLLITEFGANSLEAGEKGQAKVLKDCWTAVKESEACGGVVFSFADEWWKNYDNPVSSDNYWYRKAAPNDEATHDIDPEEYYGICTADRKPKEAFYAVQKMFAETDNNVVARIVDGAVVGLMILFAIITVLCHKKRMAV